MLTTRGRQVFKCAPSRSGASATTLCAARGVPLPTGQRRAAVYACRAVSGLAKAHRHPTTFSKSWSRQRTVAPLAAHHNPGANGGADGADEQHQQPLYLPATASTYCPFSAQLLLATSRLGHLERFRDEVAALAEPGQPVELTRCGLLISNLYQPQLDHRPYYEALEQLLASATLLVMQRAAAASASATATATATSTGTAPGCSGRQGQGADEGAAPAGGGGGLGFQGLDLRDPGHVLTAVHAISEVLFGQERLHVNAADPHDPLNGSLTDVMDTGRGNPWSLAVIFLHLAEGMGLPCALVGSPQHLFVRVGHLDAQEEELRAGSAAAMPFLVSMSEPTGAVYASPSPPHPAATGSRLQAAASLAGAGSADSSGASSGATREWNNALHAFLRLHRQQLQGEEEAGWDGSAADAPPAEAAAAAGWDVPAAAPAAYDSEFVLGEQEGSGSSGWQEVDSYAADDAASRNSWKALYGPGALAEWGGLVSSSGSSWGSGEWGSGSTLGSPAAEGSGQLGAESASPFAAAAWQPFPGDEDEGGAAAAAAGAAAAAAAARSGEEPGGLGRSASLDTCCGSTGSSSMDLDAADSPAAPAAADNTSHVGGGGAAGWAQAVRQLGWGDVPGGLQPVSKRALLQQLLGGMKLSLMMSGRQEELLLVLRYLRAVDPFSLPDLRDMALALAEEAPEEAAPLLREYLAVAPGAHDAGMMGEVLAQVQLRLQLGRARGWQ